VQTLAGLRQRLSVTIPDSAASVADIVDVLLAMDLYQPFARAALADKDVRNILSTPWDGVHYWLEAAHLKQCVNELSVRDAATMADRLHELAREVLWGQGAYGAAREEASLGAILQQRV